MVFKNKGVSVVDCVYVWIVVVIGNILWCFVVIVGCLVGIYDE